MIALERRTLSVTKASNFYYRSYNIRCNALATCEQLPSARVFDCNARVLAAAMLSYTRNRLKAGRSEMPSVGQPHSLFVRS